MDISQDLKRQRRKSEHGSEKRSQDNSAYKADDAVIVDGKSYTMPPDLKDLEEINYDDPDVKKWLTDLEAESILKYGKLTSDEAEYLCARRLELQGQLPHKSSEDLNKIAIAEFRSIQKSRR